MPGYWEMPAKTAEALKGMYALKLYANIFNGNYYIGGWMHTEDGGYMDEDGYVFIVDRIKDMIITGGENVYSAEVENAILKMGPDVAMCAVIGTPDPKFGELVTAVVVPAPGKSVSAENVVSHCRKLIAGFKVPRKVLIRDSLPMSGAGKILKNDLRKEFKTDALGAKL